MKTLEQLNTIENNYILQHGGILNITEGNWKQNTISRNKIKALKNQYGTCFLGKINLCSKDESILTEYKKGMVYNFGCNFAIPEYDQKLVDLIKQHNKDINKIYGRVERLNGIVINWV